MLGSAGPLLALPMCMNAKIAVSSITGLLIGFLAIITTIESAVAKEPKRSRTCQGVLAQKNDVHAQTILKKLRKFESKFETESIDQKYFNRDSLALIESFQNPTGKLNRIVDLRELLQGAHSDEPIFIPEVFKLLSPAEIQFIASSPEILLRPENPTEKKLRDYLLNSFQKPLSIFEDLAKEKYVLTMARLLATRFDLEHLYRQGQRATIEARRNILDEAAKSGFVVLPPGSTGYRFDLKGPDIIRNTGFKPNQKRKPGTLLDHIYFLGFGNGSFVSFSSKPGNTRFLLNPYSRSSDIPAELFALFVKKFESIADLKPRSETSNGPEQIWKPRNGRLLFNFEYKAASDRFVGPGPEISNSFYTLNEYEILSNEVSPKNVLEFRVIGHVQVSLEIGPISIYQVKGPWAPMHLNMQDYTKLFSKTKFVSTKKMTDETGQDVNADINPAKK